MAGRQRASVRRRGSSWQVRVYAGVDPLTGKDRYLTESTTTERDVEKIRTRLLAEVDQQRSPSSKAAFGYLLDAWLDVHEAEQSTIDGYRWLAEKVIKPALGDVPITKVDPLLLERLYAQLRRCRHRCGGQIEVDHRTHLPHECRSVRHRRRSGRPPADDQHNCEAMGCEVVKCKPHECKPMSSSVLRQLHWVMSGALTAAVRWKWLTSNPVEGTEPPRRPTPQPKPPSPEQAAQIVQAAWEQDADWGTLVWLVMVTGARRGEVLALQWQDLHLPAGVLEIRRAYTHRGGKKSVKDTKTHQIRRISLDDETSQLLAEHRARYDERMKELRTAPSPKAYIFSYQADHSSPCNPDAVSRRYVAMCKKLGIDSHLHAMRHYSATELLSGGVDIRTVAGRLGHGSGGSTTLRVYAAWNPEADKRASNVIASRIRQINDRPTDEE